MKAPPEVLPPIVPVRDWLSAGDWHHVGQQHLIDELAENPIWKQLYKHKPIITRTQLIKQRYMKMGEEMPDDKKWSDRDIALQVVFLNSFFFRISGMRTTTVAKEKRQADSYRKRAKLFRKTAYLLNEEGHFHFKEEREAVERVAAWYEAKADETVSLDKQLVVRRDQESRSFARAFCIQLSKITRLLYGKVLYPKVAALSRAVYGTYVSKSHVRYWSREG
jgi:hypothetical protein